MSNAPGPFGLNPPPSLRERYGLPEPPKIDWDKIRHAGDHIMPDPYPAHDQDGIPSGYPSLWNVSFGSRVQDRAGNRFLLMGYGACQGDVVLRDRYRRMFYADGNMHMEIVS